MVSRQQYTFGFLEEKEGALFLDVKAAPGSGRNAVVGVHGGRLKVAVTAQPEKGKANEAIVRVLARQFGLRRSQVSVSSGETSRDKWIRLEGISPKRLREILREALKS